MQKLINISDTNGLDNTLSLTPKICGSNLCKPKVGLIVDNDLNRHTLQRVLGDNGYQLTVLKVSDNLSQQLAVCEEPDAWLVDPSGVDIQSIINILSEHSPLPLLINDCVPLVEDVDNYNNWQKRLLEKLEVVAIPSEQSNPVLFSDKLISHSLDNVWVLAASLGGPDAIKRFLISLDDNLPVAIIYAQHIENNFDQLLSDTLGREHDYQLEMIRGEQQLHNGFVSVVPADKQIRFLEHGRMVETRQSWNGVYQPAIDQVIANLARVYRDKLGVIVFSGTCNDSEIGVRVAKACGATIWAQSPESCVSSAMPEAVINTDCVSKQGTPEELAAGLSELLATGNAQRM